MTLAASTPVTFIFTRDPAKAKTFYRDTLGLKLSFEDQFATVFDLAGVPLRIVPIPDHQPWPHTVLGWQVGNIAAAMDELRERGVDFLIYDGFGQDAAGVWTAPGGAAKVAWFNDPDGNNLSLTES